MEKMVIRYVTGLPADASRWQKRLNKKYGKVTNISRNIQYDIKHGVTSDQVKAFFSKIRNDTEYINLQKDKESMDRLEDLEMQLSQPHIR